MDLALQGVLSLKTSGHTAKYILIRPPSLEIVKTRLRSRSTDTEEAIEKRLKQAEKDWERGNCRLKLKYRQFLQWTIIRAYMTG